MSFGTANLPRDREVGVRNGNPDDVGREGGFRCLEALSPLTGASVSSV